MIRALGTGDAAAAAALHARCFAQGWSQADFARFAVDPFIVSLARFQQNDDAERLVAVLIAQRVGDDFDILTIMVDPDDQRRGHASTLLANLLALAANARCTLDVAADNAAAIALYSAHGFREVGRRKAYYAHGADALVMARS